MRRDMAVERRDPKKPEDAASAASDDLQYFASAEVVPQYSMMTGRINSAARTLGAVVRC